MTRDILQRIVTVSKENRKFEKQLIKLLKSYEKKKSSKFSLIVSSILAVILFVILLLLVFHTFLDIKFVNDIFSIFGM